MIPKKISLLEDKLDTLTNLSSLLDKHDSFIQQAKQQLEKIRDSTSLDASDLSDDYSKVSVIYAKVRAGFSEFLTSC